MRRFAALLAVLMMLTVLLGCTASGPSGESKDSSADEKVDAPRENVGSGSEGESDPADSDEGTGLSDGSSSAANASSNKVKKAQTLEEAMDSVDGSYLGLKWAEQNMINESEGFFSDISIEVEGNVMTYSYTLPFYGDDQVRAELEGASNSTENRDEVYNTAAYFEEDYGLPSGTVVIREVYLDPDGNEVFSTTY